MKTTTNKATKSPYRALLQSIVCSRFASNDEAFAAVAAASAQLTTEQRLTLTRMICNTAVI